MGRGEERTAGGMSRACAGCRCQRTLLEFSLGCTIPSEPIQGMQRSYTWGAKRDEEEASCYPHICCLHYTPTRQISSFQTALSIVAKLALSTPRNSAEYGVALPWNPDMACAEVCGYALQAPSRENQGTEGHGCAASGGSCFWLNDLTFFVPEPRECFDVPDWLKDILREQLLLTTFCEVDGEAIECNGSVMLFRR